VTIHNVQSASTKPWPSSAWTALLELTQHLAMPTLEVKLDLLEEATSVASAVDRSIELFQQASMAALRAW